MGSAPSKRPGAGSPFDYQSGYFADMLGVDASYYGVIKLAASDDFWGRSVLYNDNGQAKGFNKIGQLYLKGRLGDDDTYLHLYSGWQQIKNGEHSITPRVPFQVPIWACVAKRLPGLFGFAVPT